MTADDKLNTRLQAENDELRLELQEMHNELEISRNRYANLYDHAPLGYITVDAKGVIREINRTGAGMLGTEPSLLVGTPLISQITKGDRKKILKHLTVCKQGKTKVVSSVDLFTERGKSLHVQLHTLPLHDPRQDRTLYQTTLIDMSEVAKSNSLLEQSALTEKNNQRRKAFLQRTTLRICEGTNSDSNELSY